MTAASLRRTASRALLLTHRWLGVVCSLLVVAWFASGLVMLYARMPAVDAAERLSRLPPVDAATVAITPWEAAVAAELDPARVRLSTLLGRPAYRLGTGAVWRTVFADDGEVMDGLDPAEAMAVATRFAPGARPEHLALLDRPDQWTLQSRPFLPLHRIALGDEAGTEIYVSDRTGEVVMETTAATRAWGYAGAVLHWLYFTPLRSHSPVWSRTVLILSLSVCLLCLSGLLWGAIRIARRGGDGPRSPYSGLLRWHHYAGLAFGLFAFGWAFSGALSLEPWPWLAGSASPRAAATAVAGGGLRHDLLTVAALRSGLDRLGDAGAQVEVVQLLGVPYLLGHRPVRVPTPLAARTPYDFLSPVQPLPRRLVSLEDPRAPPLAELPRLEIEAAARSTLPRHDVADLSWLEDYDAYYYDRHGLAPLPVLRVRFDDPAATWLYLDPGTGTVLRLLERRGRLNRWLYHGLHSFDLPYLYRTRPLWDAWMIALLAGGLLVAATSLPGAWKRLTRRDRYAEAAESPPVTPSQRTETR
ncbi:MAG: PepSY domain-containing protein [Thermoanaerobaculia bacterium]|nr:PepSY domain-containing protein [Thermoanaerobaculia bacterium]